MGTQGVPSKKETTMTEVTALFPTRSEAERATEELMARGYDPGRVGYIDRHRDEHGEIITEEGYVDDSGEVAEEATKGAAGGAMGGAAVGAGAGFLTSAGLLLVPGFGPFLAAGTLAATLGGAAVGAAGGGVLGGAAGAIFGAAEDDDYPDDETSRHYREAVTAGRPMVSVETSETEASEVSEILRAAGAERVDVYGDDGWFE
jgi:hypothetical protein